MLLPEHAQTLRSAFGFDTLRPAQEPVVSHVLAGGDALVLMPTGGGKSLCYQFPALVLPGTTLVISPLIALMKDQVDSLRLQGIAAAFLNSTLDPDEEGQTLHALRTGALKLLYVAPERLFAGGDGLMSFLDGVRIGLIAIDEAHCVSQWGHDFRPHYLELRHLRAHFLGVPIVALTATADELTRKDILTQLGLPSARTFVNSFDRPNIHYIARPKAGWRDQLFEFLSTHKNETGIIYCLSRRSTESLADELQASGFHAAAYHAGLSPAERDLRQTAFIKDEVPIIVATIAFGMGIDKSNVRFVVHADLPKNLEGYYQETGRAGRDGEPSVALLFGGAGDFGRLSSFCEVEGDEKQSALMLMKLRRMVDFAESHTCRRKLLLNYFGEDAPETCGNCDNCTTVRETFDATREAQMLLSTVARLSMPYGLGYCVDILRGSGSERIPEAQRALSVFGIGKVHSKAKWMALGKELIQRGWLDQSLTRFPTLTLNARSWQVLKGEVRVELTTVETPVASSEKHRPAKAEVEGHPELFEALRVLRKQLADERNVPAYIILPDNSLRELAAFRPQTQEELYAITGFGEMKVNNFGEAVLAAIAEGCAKWQLEGNMDAAVKKPKRKTRAPKNGPPETVRKTVAAWRPGLTVEEIADKRSLSTSTIEGHLTEAVEWGILSPEAVVSAEKLGILKPAWQEYPDSGLREMRDRVGEQHSYFEIRVARAAARS